MSLSSRLGTTFYWLRARLHDLHASRMNEAASMRELCEEGHKLGAMLKQSAYAALNLEGTMDSEALLLEVRALLQWAEDWEERVAALEGYFSREAEAPVSGTFAMVDALGDTPLSEQIHYPPKRLEIVDIFDETREQ